ncbi:MAG: hypothetical protein QM817_14510 [Archangium sp.]
MIALLLAVVLSSGPAGGDVAAKPTGKQQKVQKKKDPVDPRLRVAELAPCPATRDDVKKGTACQQTDPETCQFAKSWCACEGTSCVSAAGPIPDCVSTMRWVCRDDGCPRSPVGACTNEGRQCSYDDGLCSSQVKCKKGQWVGLGQQCRPSAPPGPSY